jgi:hypothetical protein
MLSAIEIIEGFGKIMTGYLLFMDQSDIVKSSKYIDMILYNGANIVIHVFSMNVYANNSLEGILNQCCKSYVCYLEYIEQLHKTNLANNLYISDISIFVYKTTFVELSLECPNTRNKDILELLVKTWNTLLSWNSVLSFNARLAICDIYLTIYAKLFYNIPDAQVYRDYASTIQEKLEMSENVYFAFLNEYYKRIFKLLGSGNLPNKSFIMEKILLFYIQYPLEEKPTEENLRARVKRLLC